MLGPGERRGQAPAAQGLDDGDERWEVDLTTAVLSLPGQAVIPFRGEQVEMARRDHPSASTSRVAGKSTSSAIAPARSSMLTMRAKLPATGGHHRWLSSRPSLWRVHPHNQHEQHVGDMSPTMGPVPSA